MKMYAPLIQQGWEPFLGLESREQRITAEKYQIYLHRRFLGIYLMGFKVPADHRINWEANQPLCPGRKPISAFGTLARVVAIGIYCSQVSFSLKDWVLMSPVHPTVLPCEGRRPKRNPVIPQGYKQTHSLGFVLPALFYQFSPSLVLHIFKFHNKISDIRLTKYSCSISSLE